jgi:hypothetical protein
MQNGLLYFLENQLSIGLLSDKGTLLLLCYFGGFVTFELKWVALGMVDFRGRLN